MIEKSGNKAAYFNQPNPAIVVVGYNRPHCLRRILDSLQNADYSGNANIPLIVSLDNSGIDECLDIAKTFQWPHGTIRIIHHSNRLGLRRHILSCGDLSSEYGAVIIFEDDLFVSPGFYKYALEALKFYKDDDKIGGISLFSYDICEHLRHRFIPLDDGYDNYFLQMAASSGQMWTEHQWNAFKLWYDLNADGGVTKEQRIPGKICEWPESSWKKYFIRYLVETDRYFVYPRTAVSTNFGDVGTHDGGTFWNQTPLLCSSQGFQFSKLEESLSKYDVFFELKPDCLKKMNPQLNDYEFDTDFFGSKDAKAISSKYLISCRPCRHPIRSYGLRLMPESANIAFDVKGDFFFLGKVEDFGKLKFSKQIEARAHMHKISPAALKIGATVARVYNKIKSVINKFAFRN